MTDKLPSREAKGVPTAGRFTSPSRPDGIPVPPLRLSKWREKISLGGVFGDDKLSFEQKTAKVVGALKASRWYRNSDESSELHSLVQELEEADDIEQFDYLWNIIYDEADADRVWIGNTR